MDDVKLDLTGELRIEDRWNYITSSFRFEYLFFRRIASDRKYIEYEEEHSQIYRESAILTDDR